MEEQGKCYIYFKKFLFYLLGEKYVLSLDLISLSPSDTGYRTLTSYGHSIFQH